MEYSQLGSDAARVKPWGKPLWDIMKSMRSNALTPNNLKWQDDSGHHYQEFAKGPISGYLQRSMEFTDSPGSDYYDKHINNVLQPLAEKGYDLTREDLDKYLPHWDQAPNYTTDKQLQHQALIAPWDVNKDAPAINRDHYLKMVQDLKATGLDPKTYTGLPRDAGYHQKLTELTNQYLTDSKLPSLDKLTPDQQTAAFNGLDGYVKAHDPATWARKQLVDYGTGTGTAQGTKWLYSRFAINPGLALRKGLMYGGAAALTGSVGILGYLLYKNLTKKREEEDEERRQSVTKQPPANPAMATGPSFVGA
jgi:hypothetical protein